MTVSAVNWLPVTGMHLSDFSTGSNTLEIEIFNMLKYIGKWRDFQQPIEQANLALPFSIAKCA